MYLMDWMAPPLTMLLHTQMLSLELPVTLPASQYLPAQIMFVDIVSICLKQQAVKTYLSQLQIMAVTLL